MCLLEAFDDDLKGLWAKKGLLSDYSRCTGQKFNINAMVLWTINDFLLEIVFWVEWERDPPRKFDQDEILAQLARLPTRVKGKHPRYRDVKIKRNVLVDLNWTKRSIF
ncbi:hypothetical protein Tco_0647889 [Tanacetum coccineum]